MQVASTSYRAYALDLWGFGDTAHNVLSYSLDQQTELLDRFLERNGDWQDRARGSRVGCAGGYDVRQTTLPPSVDRMMAINCPLNYEAVNSRMRTARLTELIDWLVVTVPLKPPQPLSDATKADP